jgi:hypothetical protein
MLCPEMISSLLLGAQRSVLCLLMPHRNAATLNVSICAVTVAISASVLSSKTIGKSGRRALSLNRRPEVFAEFEAIVQTASIDQ